MTTSLNIVQRFEAIGLEQMEGVKLMNRTDTKFVFKLAVLAKILEEVLPFYYAVEIEGARLCKYETHYYDTKNLDLYLKHHAGKLNRYKIRHRIYRQSGIGFLEIKFKTNKGRTIKTRTKCDTKPTEWTKDQVLFLEKNQPYGSKDLSPSLRIDYNRITLVNKRSKERVTIDLQLHFITETCTKEFNQLVMAEVKQDRRMDSPFINAMKHYHVHEGSISKYCMGIAETGMAPKKNNFKEKLLKINNTNQC